MTDTPADTPAETPAAAATPAETPAAPAAETPAETPAAPAVAERTGTWPASADTVAFTADDEANALVASDPLALLIATLLNQQLPKSYAFRSPLELRDRMGGKLDAAEIAAFDPDAFLELFSEDPPSTGSPAPGPSAPRSSVNGLSTSTAGKPRTCGSPPRTARSCWRG